MGTRHLLQAPDTVIAVVGATDRLAKYGSIIYRDLKAKGYRVMAVNPYRRTVDGDPCWPTLGDLPEPPTIVDFVVPPARTLEVLAECVPLGYRHVWIQPGAADEAVRAFVDSAGLDAVIGACIMVEASDHSHRTAWGAGRLRTPGPGRPGAVPPGWG